MSDPTRLVSRGPGGGEEASDFERELLGSWDAEQPSDAARTKVLAMVGLGAGAVVGAAAAGKGTATATATAAAAGGSIAPKAALGATALVKWLVVGAVGVAAAGATIAYVRHGREETPRAVVAKPGPVAEAPRVPAEAPAPVADSPVPATPVVQETAPRAAPPAPSQRHGAPRSADPALGEQVSALDRARRALADGDASGALRQLDDYEQRFPRGALVEEADVLRVESLLAQGDRAAASRVGARFLGAHPDSPHAARVRALLGQPSSP